MSTCRFLAFGLLVYGLFSGYQVEAAVSSFTTTQQIGVDNLPPTVPDPVTATPIAATQIDITWGTSSDDFGVAGYQLFRDGTQIATTTVTTYFDTNLLPNTLYSYYVTAFDGSGNTSTSSIVVATSTFSLPVTPVSTTTSSASRLQLIERYFTLLPDINSARLTWETNIPAQFVLRYGKTREMIDEIVQTAIYRDEHSTLISDLTADTRYFYELLLIDRYGRESVLRTGEFRTLAGEDITPPANVQNLTAQVVGEDVYLTWRNPTDSDFAYVRVVRNHLFFPQDPTDGFVVYEGEATSVIDQSSLKNRARQYYTVFAFDGSGNRSSGALALGQRSAAQEVIPPTTPIIDEETSPTSTPIDSTPIQLRAEDVVFEQSHKQIVLRNGLVKLMANESYNVTVPATAVPNHLKSIIVTVQHPTDHKITQAFLLRYDKETDSYIAGIAPFSVVGDATLTISVFDYTAAVVHEVTLPVRFVGLEDRRSLNYASYLWSGLWPLLQLLLIGLTFIWFIVLWRRRHQSSAVQS